MSAKFQKRTPTIVGIQFTGSNLSDFVAAGLSATLVSGADVATISVTNASATLPPHDEYPNGMIPSIHIRKGQYLLIREGGMLSTEESSDFSNVYMPAPVTGP